MAKKEKANPTPYLGILRSRENLFTYAENRLLDQMTLEITEAFAKDLKVIRECFEKIESFKDRYEDIDCALQKKIDSFNDKNIDNFLERLEKIQGSHSELCQEVLLLKDRIRKEFIDSIKDISKKNEEIISILNEMRKEKKPWYKRILS